VDRKLRQSSFEINHVYETMNYTSLCSTAAFITHHYYYHFWHASLGVNSANTNRRHQSPQWTILSHVNCFIQGEVFGFHPRSTRASWWSPPVLRGGKLLRSSWHLFHLTFANCGRTGWNAAVDLITFGIFRHIKTLREAVARCWDFMSCCIRILLLH